MLDNGYCQIVGRIKDMLIRGGENIYPREIEEVLHTHPDIIEAQVRMSISFQFIAFVYFLQQIFRSLEYPINGWVKRLLPGCG